MNLPGLDSSVLDAVPANGHPTVELPSLEARCSGFDSAGVDREFLAGTRIQSNFTCSLGYGKPGTPFPRNPRLSFKEAGRWA